jgi:uncharacterized membrane protein
MKSAPSKEPGTTQTTRVLQVHEKELVRTILGGALSIMAILIAVVTIIASEYKRAKSDPIVAAPLFYTLVATVIVFVVSGVISALALLHLRGQADVHAYVYWGMLVLVCVVSVGLPLVLFFLRG